jgi:Domain of unknown function (DUF397)
MGDRTPVGDNEGWRKSTYSMSNGHCVETARLAGVAGVAGVAVRDSQAASGGVLRFAPEAWATFLAELRTSPSPEN